MKFFGWGRKKEPPLTQPPGQEKVKTSPDAAPPRSLRFFGSSPKWRSRDRDNDDVVIDRDQGWSPSLPRPSQDPDFKVPTKEMAGSGVDWEERLQETICFVFSHEQGGLLAIGTFALDQLAGMRLGIDVNRFETLPAATTALPAVPTIIQPPALPAEDQSSLVSNLQLTFQSSDDEIIDMQQHCCKRKELPVFGDHDALLALQPGVVTTNSWAVHTLKPNSSCTRTSITNSPDHGQLGQMEEEFYLPGVCGLFGSGSRRTQKFGEKKKQKKVSPEKRVGNKGEQQRESVPQLRATGSSKKTDRGRGRGFSSIRRLWHLPAEVTSETESSATAARGSPQVHGVPCIANVNLEGRVFHEELPSPPLACSKIASVEGGERKRVHSFGGGTWAKNGKWIRNDTEFVVLEM